MDETLEHMQQRLAEDEEALAVEMEMEELNVDMIIVLKDSIKNYKKCIGDLT